MLEAIRYDYLSLTMTNVAEMLKNETHPEALREISLFILQQSGILAKENKKFREDIIKRDSKTQERLNQATATQLHKLQRRFFDSGRETLGQRDRRRRDNKDQLLLHAQSLAGEPTPEEQKPLPVEEAPHFAKDEELLELAVKKDSELTLENAEIAEIKGFFETASEITITERTYKRVLGQLDLLLCNSVLGLTFLEHYRGASAQSIRVSPTQNLLKRCRTTSSPRESYIRCVSADGRWNIYCPTL